MSVDILNKNAYTFVKFDCIKKGLLHLILSNEFHRLLTQLWSWFSVWKKTVTPSLNDTKLRLLNKYKRARTCAHTISDIRPKLVKVRFYKSFLLHGDTAVNPKHRDTVL